MPKLKVDICVHCDLPFDESEKAYDFQRERSLGEEKISGVPQARLEIADIVNKTNL